MNGRAKVMVVDDDPMLLSLLTDTLDSIGYDSVSVPNAESALDSYVNERIDVIVADINLPGIDGLELVRRVKKLSPDVPVILITGVSLKNVKTRAFQAGADGFLDKPFRIAVIESMLQRLLKKRGFGISTVLVIDDNKDYREVLTEQLTHSGFNVLCADGGEDALRQLQDSPVDVVITDFFMPGMDGLEIAKRIKEISPTTNVVVYTGYIPDEEQECDIMTTADVFLSKPFSLEKVSKILSEF